MTKMHRMDLLLLLLAGKPVDGDFARFHHPATAAAASARLLEIRVAGRSRSRHHCCRPEKDDLIRCRYNIIYDKLTYIFVQFVRT